MRVCGGIIVEQDDIRRPGFSDSCIHRCAESAVFIQEDRADFRVVLIQKFDAAVRGVVVHHQDFKIAAALL